MSDRIIIDGIDVTDWSEEARDILRRRIAQDVRKFWKAVKRHRKFIAEHGYINWRHNLADIKDSKKTGDYRYRSFKTGRFKRDDEV